MDYHLHTTSGDVDAPKWLQVAGAVLFLTAVATIPAAMVLGCIWLAVHI